MHELEGLLAEEASVDVASAVFDSSGKVVVEVGLVHDHVAVLASPDFIVLDDLLLAADARGVHAVLVCLNVRHECIKEVDLGA